MTQGRPQVAEVLPRISDVLVKLWPPDRILIGMVSCSIVGCTLVVVSGEAFLSSAKPQVWRDGARHLLRIHTHAYTQTHKHTQTCAHTHYTHKHANPGAGYTHTLPTLRKETERARVPGTDARDSL